MKKLSKSAETQVSLSFDKQLVMKKLIERAVCTVLTALLLFVMTSCNTGSLYDSGALSKALKKCDSAFVIMPDSSVIYSGNENERVYPASITKLFAIMYALELVPEPDTYLITPGDEVYLPKDGSSSAFIRPNHILSLKMLIEAMLIPSGNDAAYAVAASLGRSLSDDTSLDCEEAVAVFVDGMNEYAASIGCHGTHFTTPDGYADIGEHYSTIEDMAIISALAADNDIIRSYCSIYSTDVVYKSGHINTWVNTNKFLNPKGKYYDSNVTGLKTGSLDNYYSLILTYDADGEEYIIGVFGSSTDNGRYKDAERITGLIQK